MNFTTNGSWQTLVSRVAASAAGVIASGALIAPSATALEVGIDDTVGDNSAQGPDIVAVAVKNEDRKVKAIVDLAGPDTGNVIVSLDQRAGRGVALAVRMKADGTLKPRFFKGAFTDDGALEPRAKRCEGYRVSLDEAGDTVRFTMPSRCLVRGNYGALSFIVLTETPEQSDADFAPDSDDGLTASDWIPRG